MNYKKIVYVLLLVIITISFMELWGENPQMISFSTEEGRKLFHQSQYREAFWRISRNFEAQERINNCGIASSVIALNALKISSPNHQFWTQDEFLAQQPILPLEIVDQRGMNLRELKMALGTFNVNAIVYYWDQNQENKLREMIKNGLNDPQQVILANYYRPALGLPGQGHYSPIVAYDQETDTVLMMDVAEDRPPPVWVSLDALMSSMKPVRGKTRGFLVISSA